MKKQNNIQRQDHTSKKIKTQYPQFIHLQAATQKPTLEPLTIQVSEHLEHAA